MLKSRNKLTITLVIIIIVLCGTAGYFAYRYVSQIHNDPAYQTKELVNHIGKAVTLPDETPTVATVSDKAKLSNQLLREKAQNDDKLLIYSSAKRVILYRPSTGKVVEMLTIQTP